MNDALFANAGENSFLNRHGFAGVTDGGWWGRALASLRPSGPDAAQVTRLVEEIVWQPTLQSWLLTAAGQSSPRARRALLRRAAEVLRANGQGPDALVMEELMCGRVLAAVLEVLFRRGGLEGARAQMGRAARMSLESLRERLRDGVAGAERSWAAAA